MMATVAYADYCDQRAVEGTGGANDVPQSGDWRHNTEILPNILNKPPEMLIFGAVIRHTPVQRADTFTEVSQRHKSR